MGRQAFARKGKKFNIALIVATLLIGIAIGFSGRVCSNGDEDLGFNLAATISQEATI